MKLLPIIFSISFLSFQVFSIGAVLAQPLSLHDPNTPLKGLTDSEFEKILEEFVAQPTPFTDVCKSKDKSGILGLNVERQHTINVLLEVAGTQDCEKAEMKLNSLTSLSLFHKRIRDVEPIRSLTNLTYLDLTLNNIDNLWPLRHSIKLSTLKLDNNGIVDVKPLGSLSKLTSLSLRHNKIVDVSSLASLSKLTDLNLSVNQIVEVKQLASLNKLTALDLYKNQIRDVSSLASLNKLTTLELRRNSIAVKTCPLKPESICKF